MTITETQYQAKLDQARAKGHAHGQIDGSWATDGNMSDEALHRLLQGYEDGDPEIMDSQPAPLSGEWADGLLIDDVLIALDIEPYNSEDSEWADAVDDILGEFEDGYSEGYWQRVTSDCRALLGLGASS